MKVKTATCIASGTEMLCGFVFSDARRPPEFGIGDGGLAPVIEQAAADTAGRSGRISVVPTGSKKPARRILLAGLGRPDAVTPDLLRHVSGRIAKRAREMGIAEFVVLAPPGTPLPQGGIACAIAEGAVMSMYRFDKFKSTRADDGDDCDEAGGGDESQDAAGAGAAAKAAAPPGEPAMTIITDGSDPQKEVAGAVREAVTIAEGTTFVRGIANLPPNECTPSTLAETARDIAKNARGLKCTVISKNALRTRGFGGITAVGQGSRNEPKLIILEYRGGKRAKGAKGPVVLVGKAVTFDTGGISLKPGARMDEMKFDKCGGCTVLGILKAAAELKLKTDIVGIVPAVENMPGGESYRPGDIIRLYSGKTAEIINTDAEGRLILADALAYGEQRYGPRAMIDFATLTGACIVALGTNVAGMISNDQKLAGRMSESSGRTDEAVWQLPLDQDYMDMIKSQVADMRNLGIGRVAGTIAAAAFLQKAVAGTPWVHFDIAGVAWTQEGTKPRSYRSKGATGFGVRLIMDYLRTLEDG